MVKQTKYLTFQGKCKWAKLDKPDTRFDPEGKWSLVLYPNAESCTLMHELKKEGIRNVIKKDEDGEYITWSRACQKRIKGRLKAFNPPDILDKNSNPLPRTTLIGNGSDITVSIEVYYFTTPQKTEGCACRLASVRIDNLVTYTRDDFTQDQLRATKGLVAAPPQLF